MEKKDKVCVIVPVYNRLESTKKFILSFEKNTYKNYTIVVFDDGSTDGTYDYLKRNYPEVVVLRGDGSNWWSGSTNAGVRYAIDNGFDYVLTINNDSHVKANLLEILLKCAKANWGCIIGSRVMIGNTDLIWSLGTLVYFRKFPFLHLNQCQRPLLVMQKFMDPFETMALAGNGVLVPIDIFKKIGLYDAKWCPQYHGDTEFTYRATKSGTKCLVCLDAVVYNNEFVADPKFSMWDEMFSKKSPHYWRPTVRFYWKHAPWKHKPYLIKQFLWIPKRIVKAVLSRA